LRRGCAPFGDEIDDVKHEETQALAEEHAYCLNNREKHQFCEASEVVFWLYTCRNG
jgi:hypothetical protein